MGWDEMEWVRDVIDRWLAENGTALGLVLAASLAIASVLLTN